MNKLDDQITEITLCTEKQCSTIGRKPTIPWSPHIHEAIQNIYHAQYERPICRKELMMNYTAPKDNYKNACNRYKKKAQEAYTGDKKLLQQYIL